MRWKIEVQHSSNRSSSECTEFKSTTDGNKEEEEEERGRGRAGPRAVISGEISATARDLVLVHGMTMREAAQSLRNQAAQRREQLILFFSLKIFRVSYLCNFLFCQTAA